MGGAYRVGMRTTPSLGGDMNATPCAAKVAMILSIVTWRTLRGPASSSSASMVARPTPDAATRSRWDQPRNARAARRLAGVIWVMRQHNEAKRP